MRKKYFCLLLCLTIFTPLLYACAVESDGVITMQSTDEVLQTALPAPSVPIVNTEPVTRTFIRSGGLDVAVYDGAAYVLLADGVQTFVNGVETTFIPLGNDPADALKPTALAVTADGLYVAYRDEIDCVVLIRHTMDGTPEQTYQSVTKSNATSVVDFVVLENMAYLSLFTANNNTGGDRRLFICDLADDELHETEIPAFQLCLYRDGQIVFSDGDATVTSFGIYNTQDDSVRMVDLGKGFAVRSFAYDMARDVLYACGGNALSKYRFTPEYAGLFLAAIDVSTATAEYIAPVRDGSGNLAIAGADLLILENENELYAYNNLDGYRGVPLAPLRILCLVTTQEQPDNRIAFAALHTETVFSLWEKKGIAYWDADITMKQLPVNASGALTVDDIDLSGETFDIVLIPAGYASALKETDGLYALSDHKGIQAAFDEMLPGVEALCTVNERLLGAPVYVWANGLSQNIQALQNLGAEQLPFNWTLQDYYAFASVLEPRDDRHFLDRSMLERDNEILSRILDGEHIPEAELIAYFSTYQNIITEGLYKDVFLRPNDTFEAGILASVYKGDAVPFPRISRESRIPVRMCMIAVNNEAVNRDAVLDYVETFISKEVTTLAHQGDFLVSSAGINNTMYCPVWYDTPGLWAIQPSLGDYSYMLAHSTPDYAMMKPGLYEESLYTAVSDIMQRLWTEKMTPATCAAQIFTAQKIYLGEKHEVTFSLN